MACPPPGALAGPDGSVSLPCGPRASPAAPRPPRLRAESTSPPSVHPAPPTGNGHSRPHLGPGSGLSCPLPPFGDQVASALPTSSHPMSLSPCGAPARTVGPQQALWVSGPAALSLPLAAEGEAVGPGVPEAAHVLERPQPDAGQAGDRVPAAAGAGAAARHRRPLAGTSPRVPALWGAPYSIRAAGQCC